MRFHCLSPFRLLSPPVGRYIINLMSISRLIAKEVAGWRERMLDQAAMLMESPFFAVGVEHYLQGFQPENAGVLMDRIRSIEQHYHYPSVIPVDRREERKMTYGEFSRRCGESNLQSTLSQAMAQRRQVISDLYADEQIRMIFILSWLLLSSAPGTRQRS